MFFDALGLSLSRPVGVFENFFELGGNSLLAVKAVLLLRASISLQASVRDIFLFPTVAGLA